ncbi:hypothetical protein GTP91_10505 [Rugamonas sp. FT82W]|uniref:Discoidin domain-containing protein n=1 Tax=Duganella vulcania TaxID=2692166 RepID=A0A845G1W5_9BURK|nr:hypothetical protein [Duganella vulcania]MYM87610.1 hypothetical protein [Duganella vulcania]
MKRQVTMAILMSTLALAACHKKDKPADAPTVAAPDPAASAGPVVPLSAPAQTADQEEMARKQALLDYGTMEDKYLNDPKAQWAATAKASTTFGDDNGKEPSEVNVAKNVVGPSDDRSWTNNNQDKGFDWLEVGYAKPVNATELRVIFPGGQGVEAVSKVELQDADGKWNTIWSGISDVKQDKRGSRTWFVRTFDKTAYKVKGAKITIANNVQHGYKEVEAVQLVGE